MFQAFSDRTRLRILHLLRDGELRVCDLVDVMPAAAMTARRFAASRSRVLVYLIVFPYGGAVTGHTNLPLHMARLLTR
jgi:DNA-binding transcriptional ArsR family regulator